MARLHAHPIHRPNKLATKRAVDVIHVWNSEKKIC